MSSPHLKSSICTDGSPASSRVSEPATCESSDGIYVQPRAAVIVSFLKKEGIVSMQFLMRSCHRPSSAGPATPSRNMEPFPPEALFKRASRTDDDGLASGWLVCGPLWTSLAQRCQVQGVWETVSAAAESTQGLCPRPELQRTAQLLMFPMALLVTAAGKTPPRAPIQLTYVLDCQNGRKMYFNKHFPHGGELREDMAQGFKDIPPVPLRWCWLPRPATPAIHAHLQISF